MAPLHLDFVRKPSAFGALAWFGLILLIAGLLLAVNQVWSFIDTNTELAAAEGRWTSLNKKSSASHKTKAATADPLSLAAPAALRQLNLPWDTLLLELEQAGDASVAVLVIEPDPAKAQVRINGEGRSIADVLAYVERLGGTVSLRRPQLQVEEVRQSDGEKVVGFSILADWELP